MNSASSVLPGNGQAPAATGRLVAKRLSRTVTLDRRGSTRDRETTRWWVRSASFSFFTTGRSRCAVAGILCVGVPCRQVSSQQSVRSVTNVCHDGRDVLSPKSGQQLFSGCANAMTSQRPCAESRGELYFATFALSRLPPPFARK